MNYFNREKIFASAVIVFLSVTGMLAIGVLAGNYIYKQPSATADNLRFDEQEATVRAIKKVSPAVVNIAIFEKVVALTDDSVGSLTITSEDKRERSQGTGFLISADGLIITNKHVVKSASDPATAEFKVTLSSGKKYYAQLIGLDPLNDLAVLKIFDKNLPYVELGNSDQLTPGISVVAIGNALGQYQNSVTKGIVSGLGRDLVASDSSGNAEALGNVIQTDAEINIGNSGGPLVDLNGRVVGINVATDASGKSIGFAIPVNDAKPVIKSAREIGRIVRPRLGIRYRMITPQLAADNKLPVSVGAWVAGGGSEPAVVADSPAEKAGVKAGDIIIEIDGVKLSETKTLISIVQNYKPGQKIGLKTRRGNQTLVLIAVLDEFK